MWVISFLLSILVIFILTCVLYIKWSQNYWARKKIPYIKPTSLWGNIENPFKQKLGVKLSAKEAYMQFKRQGVPHGGIYKIAEPVYMPINPELIKSILAKDFSYFNGHGFPHDAKKDPLSAHLFNLDGDSWRNTRIKLTPVFTSGKMKTMFNTVLDCGKPLTQHINAELGKNKSLNIHEIISFYTIDTIGSCVFGVECNSFKDPNAEFKKFGHQVIKVSPRNKIYNFIKFVAPTIGKFIHVRRVSLEMERFVINMIQGVFDYRKSAKIVRKDFIQLFMELEKKAKANKEDSFTIQEIAAQAYIFIVGGFETAATTMTFLLHELAYNQEIQEKLRNEIRETLRSGNGSLTYDGMTEMKYMDQVVNETLRKYPPLAFLNRICTKDYKVPNTDVTINKGTPILISSMGLHHDSEYYPNPEKFDPGRFIKEKKKYRPSFTFIPFGEGPRICIGQRFGLMQIKIAIFLLLNDFKFLPSDQSNYKLIFEPTSVVLGTKEVVKLNIVKLNH
ncbi:cytochrome p450 [Holotrichia oblita]|uniref:Cytochrome p450 n=1 Tax=Holotrichia oblita TaxID=644536 RepID=A0ACB9SXH6_HOLOL|nr:cytochrome p450 [Holotrichia oblita]